MLGRTSMVELRKQISGGLVREAEEPSRAKPCRMTGVFRCFYLRVRKNHWRHGTGLLQCGIIIRWWAQYQQINWSRGSYVAVMVVGVGGRAVPLDRGVPLIEMKIMKEYQGWGIGNFWIMESESALRCRSRDFRKGPGYNETTYSHQCVLGN